MSSSNSPCAACKLLRRKCTQGCVFAPYFPPDQPTKFSYVHRVFGASNVAKLLNDLSPAQREDAVNSLAYEAQARLNDPVHGCVGYIYLLQHKLEQVQSDLNNAKKELATYIGPAALGPFIPQTRHHPLVGSQNPPYQYNQNLQGGSGLSVPPFGIPGVGVGMGMGLGLASPAAMQQHPQMLLREQQPEHQQHHPQQHQHIDEAQQQIVVAAAAAAREQELLRTLSQQQQDNQIARFGNVNFPVEGNGRSYGQISGGNASGLTLVPAQAIDGGLVVQQQQHLHLINEQYPQQQNLLQAHHHRVKSDEERSGI